VAVMLMSEKPAAELGTVRTRLDCLYDEWLNGGTPAWTAAIDIVRTVGSLVVRADLPGVKPDAVRIDVEDGILTVSGDPGIPGDRADARYVRRERRAGPFCRSVMLPADVDADKVRATISDGVIEVTIPLPLPASRERPGRLAR
jgi:HSP20 family protein